MKTNVPTPTVFQLCTTDDNGDPILSVVAKRTYVIDGGACSVSPDQVPLLAYTVAPDDETVLHDADIWAMKPMTDVVVLGHAYAHGGGCEIVASVAVQALLKEIAVVGDRRVTRAGGRIVFSEPARFEKMPLGASRAYGGYDRASEQLHPPPEPHRRTASGIGNEFSPYRYPRNGAGRGFVVDETDAAIEAAALPNLEDPSHRLTPERFIVGSPTAWTRMPLPWTTGWQSFGDFPRYGYFGMIAKFEELPGDIEEMRRGFVPKEFPTSRPGDMRVFNGGSLGLQLPQVVARAAGKLDFRLKNMHPTRRELSFSLPAETPTIKVGDHKGVLTSTDPVVHHVVIEPDLDRVTVVWRGAARTKRRYALEELRTMPLEVTWP